MAILLVYFERRDGKILIPPTSDTPTPKDCIRKEATDLNQVDRVQKILLDELKREWEQGLERDERIFLQKRQEVTDRLTARMHSAATSDYEKEFIRYYLQVYRMEKRAKYRQKFTADTAYFLAREFDNPQTKTAEIEESKNG